MSTLILAKALYQHALKQYKNAATIPFMFCILLVHLSEYDFQFAKEIILPIKRKLEWAYMSNCERGRDYLWSEIEKMDLVNEFMEIKNKRKVSAFTFPFLKPNPNETYDEHSVPLRESALWTQSMQFYKKSDLQAWVKNDVPYGISTSDFVAQRYASFVLGCCGQQRCTVLEFGSGNGILAYRIARNIEKHASQYKLEVYPRVVMTDFHGIAFEKLMHVEAFASLVQRGFLDFAIVDINNPKNVLELAHSKENFVFGQHFTVLIANYVFDSLPADVLHREMVGSRIFTGQCSIQTRKSSKTGAKILNVDSIRMEFLENCELRYRKVQIPNNRLALYPRACIDMLNQVVSSYEDENLCLIVGDKMIDSRDDQVSAWENGIPGLDEHGGDGCISVCLDPYLLSEEITGLSKVWLDRTPNESFAICVYYFEKKAMPRVEIDMRVFEKCFNIMDYDRLRGWLVEGSYKEFIGNLPLNQVVQLLEVSEYDFELFQTIRWNIRVHSLDSLDRDRLFEIAMRCFENRFFMMPDQWISADFKMSQWLFSRAYYKKAKDMIAKYINDTELRSLMSTKMFEKIEKLYNSLCQ